MSKNTLDPNRAVHLDELRILKRREREIRRELTEAEKRFKKEQGALKTARRNVQNALGRIGKRKAIVNGRLSK